MGCINWDVRFLELAREVSTWSKDPSFKVGAVIVNPDREVVGLGYNGFPRGVIDDPERYNDRETKLRYVVHAEVNAIINAGHRARGGCLYVYPSLAIPPTCCDCCKAAIQAGIFSIVGYEPDPAQQNSRWKDSIEAAAVMCKEANIEIVSVPRA